MKKNTYLVLFILGLFITTHVQAQKKPLRNDTIYADADPSTQMSTKVSMEINPKLFPRTQGSMFISEAPRAMIMPMVMRANFDSLDQKKLLDETALEMDMNILKKGVMKKKGKTLYYLIGNTKDKARNITLEIYFVKANANSTIMVTGFYDTDAKKIFSKEIRNAALSARLD